MCPLTRLPFASSHVTPPAPHVKVKLKFAVPSSQTSPPCLLSKLRRFWGVLGLQGPLPQEYCTSSPVRQPGHALAVTFTAWEMKKSLPPPPPTAAPLELQAPGPEHAA